MSQVEFVPLKHKAFISDSLRDQLQSLLKEWREARKIAERGERSFLSSQLYLPDDILKTLVDHAGYFLGIMDITPEVLRNIVQWDLASLSALQEVAAIISGWRQEAALQVPPSHGLQNKKARGNNLREDETIKNDLTPRPSPCQPFMQPLPQASFSPSRHENPISGVSSDPDDKPAPVSDIMSHPSSPHVTHMPPPNPAIHQTTVPNSTPIPNVYAAWSPVYLPTSPPVGYYSNYFQHPYAPAQHSHVPAQNPHVPAQHPHGPPHVHHLTAPTYLIHPNQTAIFPNQPIAIYANQAIIYSGQPVPVAGQNAYSSQPVHVPGPGYNYMYPYGQYQVAPPAQTMHPSPHFYYQSQFPQPYYFPPPFYYSSPSSQYLQPRRE